MTPTRTSRNRAALAPWPVWATCSGWPLPQLGVPHTTQPSRLTMASQPAPASIIADVYETTWYFRAHVMRKRPYLRLEWCIAVIESPIRREVQSDGRIRFWGRVPEFGDRVFRVVTLADGRTILNAFPDRGFQAAEP